MLFKAKRILLNDPKKLLLYPAIKKDRRYSLTSEYVNYCQLYDALRDLRGIEGSIVEIGCWKGGLGVLMKHWDRKREAWLFDSFEGLPQFSIKDFSKAMKKGVGIHENPKLIPSNVFRSDEARVHECARDFGVDVNVRAGWFQDTLPKALSEIGDIALLHIDADIYESTKYALETLYDQVAKGGMIIFDDYGSWHGCNMAVHEFMTERQIDAPLFYYPYGGRLYFRKRSKTNKERAEHNKLCPINHETREKCDKCTDIHCKCIDDYCPKIHIDNCSQHENLPNL